jgi:hypothetical protein
LVAEFEVAASAETSTAEVEDDATIESEVVADVDMTTAEDEDDVIVTFAPVARTDAGTVAEDEDDDELVLELITVSDAEEELETVAEMASARTLPSVELLELYMDCMIEELEVGWLDSEDELERTLLEDIDVDIPMLLADSVELPVLLEDVELLMLREDDVKVERTLLDRLDELVLDFDVLLLVEDAKLRLEDGVGEVDRIFEVELDRDEVEDDGAEELPAVLLLLMTLEELLLVVVVLLLFLLDVLVLFLLVLILVSDALKELDVVAVTFFVSFLLDVNGFAHYSMVYNLTYSVDVTVLDTVAVTTIFEGDVALIVLSTVLVDILRRDWQ